MFKSFLQPLLIVEDGEVLQEASRWLSTAEKVFASAHAQVEKE